MKYYKLLEILNKHKLKVALLLGFFVGVLAININNPAYVPPDSVNYHNYAVNIAEKGVYSSDINEPFELDFFREPGYNFLLGGTYWLYNNFGNIEHIDYYNDYNKTNRTINNHRKEISFARYMQLIIILASIFIFYKNVTLFFNSKISFIFLISISLYYPFIAYSFNLLREPLLTFLFAGLTYSLGLYFKTHKRHFIFISSIILALSTLTLQIGIVFTPIILIAIIIVEKNYIKILKNASISGVFYIAALLPWLITAYSHYPDWRIIKSIGTSLTHESLNYGKTVGKAYRSGLITEDKYRELKQKNWFHLSSKEQFNRSFNGWYKNQADSINRIIKSSQKLSSEARKVNYIRFIKKLKNAIIINNWRPAHGFTESLENKKYFSLLLHLFSIFVGFISVLGILFFPKKKLIYFLPQILFILLFYWIGSETRRLLPAYPLLILFAVYFTYNFLYKALLKKVKIN